MLVAIAIVTVAVLWIIRAVFSERSPLDDVPGPPRVPILGNIQLMLKTNPESLLPTLNKLTQEYGDRYVTRILKTRILHLSKPEDIEVILTNSRNITKSFVYDFIRPWLGTGLIINTGYSWFERRKMMAPTFHYNILKNFATVMEEKTRDLVQMLRTVHGAEVDVFPIISDLTLFIICETAMGTKLDSDKSSHTIEYKNSIQTIGDIVVQRLSKLYLYNDLLFNIFRGKQFNKILKTAHTFAEAVIIEKKKKLSQDKEGIAAALTGEDFGTKKRVAMLDLLLESERKREIDLAGVRDEVTTFMFAGHDASALAITYCLMLLADHEDVQDKIVEEGARILSGQIRSDRFPTVAQLSEMTYLEAVIKETMRLYTSVPFIGRHIEEDFMLGDLLVKKGTNVTVHLYDLHHRADIYPDPYAFKPERFLGGETRHPYAYIPFSAGPRNCLGLKFAMQEIKLIITQICQNFRLKPKIKGYRPKLKTVLVLRPAEPIYVKFIPRNEESL